MSAYGPISKRTTTATPLRPRTYRLPDQSASLTVFPIQDVLSSESDDVIIKNPDRFEPLWKHLSGLFDSIVAEGRTYPQEEMLGLDGFKKYFLSHDIFIGVLDAFPAARETPDGHHANREEGVSIDKIQPHFLLDLISDRPLQETIAGIYYIKPNYPGRSAHCCNGGFVVDPRHRGRKIGKTLARSFLHYAPLLGYRASVFNLVYKNNLASVAIWDSLGFQRVGLIPQAGRLKTISSNPDGQSDEGEEYVDAIVYWKELI
ncbi:hypothetical protein PTTG_04669 [Puccinia triticina 1-1 BBBD Race 1]|uniref:N-acetyltransferase domain-containing protein n=2 Tax=Puccinia triticina TaxID=208348 RepID=A0A180GQT4_PUCT1|nr:uncharacterized protein PtA15_14A108 [Puccinia triticina]OAV94911.1 hypothetical protein PTTG_04669 [Puccinia triticina 1-1 BBBD Race 1]WAQ91226.1 hypothetical protein PtA15_14A108 [Puccinia triticina]WAR62027.1 hypothetical protein PtB15_14B121 [Puccinia triticina]